MNLLDIAGSADPAHLTACPFVLPGTPEPGPAPFAGQPDREVSSA
jgi:hypothetical protein